MGFAERLRAWLRGDDAASSGDRAGTSRGDSPRASRSDPELPRASDGPRTGRRGRRRGARGQHPAGSFDGSALLEFARSRSGVEVYLEPRTNLYGDSVLLVADDGEYLRRPVPDAPTVRAFCSEHGIPVYDAARTGYPRRVRDYDRGVRPRRIGLEDLPPWPGAQPPSGTSPHDRSGAEEGTDADDASSEDDEPPPPPPAAS